MSKKAIPNCGLCAWKRINNPTFLNPTEFHCIAQGDAIAYTVYNNANCKKLFKVADVS